MTENIFFQITIILGITVSIAFLMRLLRQPLLIAYLVAGIFAGPMFLNLLEHGGQTFDALAEFGVVLLLFVAGLSLNIQHIKEIGKVSLISGIAQVVFTATIGAVILLLMNFDFVQSLYLAIAITFSSTIIIIKLLTDKKDTETVYGRHTIGLMIVQDIIAIAIMMIITSVGRGGSWSMEVAELVGKSLILIAFIIITARFVVPKILDSVAKSGEFLFIFTVTWCFGIASLLYWLGFSIEIGAIVAGLTLGSSPYQREIASRVKPLRDFFLVIFFIILGSEMSLSNLGNVWLPGLILAIFILVGNPLVLYLTFRFLKFTRRNSLLAGLTAAQVSEFGFVLLIVGRGAGHINGPELEIFTIVALTTIIISSYLITYNEKIYLFLKPFFEMFGKDSCVQNESKESEIDVLVFGYHRIGWKICDALADKGVNFAVVDYNPLVVNKLKERNINSFFGDASDVEFLETLPLSSVKIVLSTIPEADDQLTLINYIRGINKKALIVCSLYHVLHLDDLYEAGANYVMMPHLLGGQWMSEVLKHHAWTKETFKKLRAEQKNEMKLRYSVGTHA